MLTDWLVLLFPKQAEEGVKKKALLIKLDAIGDFILWLDAAKEMLKLFPPDKYELTLIGNSVWIPFAEKLPYFDAVWLVDRRNFLRNPFYRFTTLRKVRRNGFHMVIQPTFSREFVFGDAIVRASGAHEKIGSQGDHTNTSPWQKRFSDRWYTRLIPAVDKPLMELVRNAEFIRGLGINDFYADVSSIPIHSSLPTGFGIKDYYVLFPGAGVGLRQWPLSNFIELANRMYQATGWIMVICGGSGDKHLGEALENNTDAALENWCGKTSLDELVAIIEGAHMLIGNETSAVHIAAALSIPSVCIMGGGHYGRFVPYQTEIEAKKPFPVVVTKKMSCFGCNWHCIYTIPKGQSVPCIINITVDNVWNVVQRMIKNPLPKKIRAV